MKQASLSSLGRVLCKKAVFSSLVQVAGWASMHCPPPSQPMLGGKEGRCACRALSAANGERRVRSAHSDRPRLGPAASNVGQAGREGGLTA